MATYTQAGRPLILTTPLGKDVLIATGFSGAEGLSQLFRYTIDAKAARGTDIPFDGLIGKNVGLRVELPNKGERFFAGVCVKVLQGESDPDFTDYQMEIVPEFWLLTKKTQSRIFQHKTVPDILKEVLRGLKTDFRIQGSWYPRDFCVQYRESDYNFASRLMEEEGIYYYFKHDGTTSTMVLANTPASHDPVPGKTTIVYKNVSQEAVQGEDHVYDLAKLQEQVSGKFLLWDHTFEKPHEHLEADKPMTGAVNVGKVSHNLKAGDNDKWEIYDWPGEYAQRFDGIAPGGGDRPADLAEIPKDNKRTVNLRMEAEAATAVSVRGAGSARQLASGHKFTMTTVPADLVATPIKAEGEYVVTHLSHSAHVPANYRSGEANESGGFRYDNTFVAIPAALTFRPQRTTAKPVVSGTQTAVVVGPPGEEIFTDKYGRIKVKFHWDRKPEKNADSSCWIRVVHVSAGRHWGAFHLPRIGQEVLIDFQEGDPDQPICLGCLYNPDQPLKYKLPDEKTKSYIRTNSSLGGVGYNEIRFEDKAGKEQVYFHAQRNEDTRVRNDCFERIGMNRHLRVGFYLPNDHKGDLSGEEKKGNQYEEVAIDQHLKVHNNTDEQIGGDYKLLVGGIGSGPNPGKGDWDVHVKRKKHELIDDTSDLHVKKAVTELYDDTYDLHVKKAVKQKYDNTYDLHVLSKVSHSFDADFDLKVGGDEKHKVGGTYSITSGSDFQQKTGQKHCVEAGMEVHLKAGMKVIIEAPQVSLKGMGGFIDIGPSGVAIQGMTVLINSGGSAGSGSGAKPKEPAAAQDAKDAEDARDANPTKPTDADHSETGEKSN